MKTPDKLKECFGDQGGSMLGGEPPDECLDCEIFDKCHKITVAATLQAINCNLSLLVQNGLESGQLKPFKDLGEK